MDANQTLWGKTNDRWRPPDHQLEDGRPSSLGRSGTGYLKVDGKVVAEQKMEKTVPMLLQWDENFDVGADTGSPVADEDYHTPFSS